MAALPLGRRDAVLDRFGFSTCPPIDVQGLRDTYRAWCRHVPFDNVRKLIALQSGSNDPLPGLEPDDFFGHWLRHGTGGTCWPSSSALVAFLTSVGFGVRPVAGEMFETGELSHGSAIVSIGGAELLVDSSMLTDAPLEFAGDDASVTDPVHPFVAEPVEGSWRFRFGFVFEPIGTPVFWRMVVDPAPADVYAQRYERSRQNSVFNDSRFARRNDEAGICALVKDTYFTKTPAGISSEPDLDPAGQDRVMVETFGYSEEIIAALRSAVPGTSISGT